jgi:integrase/recombinase XerD
MVTQKIPIKVYMHKFKASEKQGYIYIRAKIPGQKKYKPKSLGYKIPEEFWDQDNERVKKEYKDAQEINDKINEERVDLRNRLNSTAATGRSVTELVIKDALSSKKYSAGTFIAFFEKHIEFLQSKDQNGKPRVSEGHINHWRSEYNRIVAYAGYNLMFSDVTTEWLQAYEMDVAKSVNRDTTLHIKMKRIRELILKAEKMELMRTSQAAGYKIPPYVAPERNYLTLQETDMIWELLEKNKLEDPLLTIAAFFLVECYSGIRFSDWSRFKVEKLIDHDKFKVRAKKNGEPIYLPLKYFPRLRKVLKYIKDNDLKCPWSEKTTNAELKVLANMLNLEFNLTTHNGRHTCGTLLGELGYAAKDIGEVLGISEQTAKVYLKNTRKALENAGKMYGGL